jgi:polysaccharide pyruvyl transferase WcaK-like protein
MSNKGTQALLKSDVLLIHETVGQNVAVSVSTTDIKGVKKQNLPLKKITSPMIDIPYEKADSYAHEHGLQRYGWRYKMFAVASFFYMFVQILLSLLSVAMIKIGIKPMYRSNSLELINNSDVVVTCSDENFKESSSMLPQNVYWIMGWWSMLLARTFEVVVAKLLRKRLVMFPNSIGPFRTKIGMLLSKIALNFYDSLLIRDSLSLDTVKTLNLKGSILATSDTALILKRVTTFSSKETRSLVIGVSPGVYSGSLSKHEIQEYITVHAKALDEAIDTHHASVVFLPHYISDFSDDDLQLSKKILDKMKNSSKAQITEIERVEDFKSQISQTDLIVSSKMHPAVLAVSAFVPVLCIAYDNKQIGFLSDLDLSDCVIRLDELTKDLLSMKIDHVYNNREKITKLLRKNVPEKQKNIRDSVARVLSLYSRNFSNNVCDCDLALELI